MSQSSPKALAPWRQAIIDFFVRAADLLGMPRSYGEIYGLLYSSEKPLQLSEVVEELGISKGSASQGLRALRQFGAVKTVFVPGDRRDYYEAELHLKRMASGFLRDQINPHLESGEERLGQIKELLDDDLDSLENPKEMKEKVAKLKTWHKRAHQLVPLILKIAGG
ncbi:MAG: GbsR/MarR family transcriptional regulator [Opitutales bacterium]